MIYTKSIIEDIKDATGASGSRFERAALSAFNKVIEDLKTQCFLDDLVRLDNLDTDIDLDSKYQRAFDFGIKYYLFESGEWGRKPSASAAQDYQRALALCQYESIQELDPDTGNPPGDWAG